MITIITSISTTSSSSIIFTQHGAVLIFTGLRIRAALQRQSDQIRQYQNTSENSTNFGQQSITRRCTTLGSRRTLKILTFTSLAYFTLWTPYVFVVMTQSFTSSFKPPAAVEFTVMWLANSNSAVNVFIYSSTNTQFRRQCVLLASRLCCSRLSCFCITRNTHHHHPRHISISISACNQHVLIST